MAIRAAAHGKSIAYSVDQFLNVVSVTGPPHRFDSVMGRMQDGEIDEYIKESETFERVEPENGLERGYSGIEAIRESTRCFHCDCRKRDTCKLRQYADEYGVEQRRFKTSERKRFQKIVQHDLVVYEPGKCIKCSLCVQITRNAGEELGLTFVNRGFDVRVATPFNETLNRGLKEVAGKCVEACPTAALSWRHRPEESEYVEC
jgi:ferredoxin